MLVSNIEFNITVAQWAAQQRETMIENGCHSAAGRYHSGESRHNCTKGSCSTARCVAHQFMPSILSLSPFQRREIAPYERFVALSSLMFSTQRPRTHTCSHTGEEEKVNSLTSMSKLRNIQKLPVQSQTNRRTQSQTHSM